ncbi:MAG TPA: hypothetical protein VGK01_26875 [Candidatus Angelobacter sp.]
MREVERLDNVIQGSPADGFNNHAGTCVAGEHNDLLLRACRTASFNCAQPVHLWHGHVQQNQVWLFATLKPSYRFCAARRRFYPIMGHFQQAPGVLQNARIVVNNKNAFFAGSQRRALHLFLFSFPLRRF